MIGRGGKRPVRGTHRGGTLASAVRGNLHVGGPPARPADPVLSGRGAPWRRSVVPVQFRQSFGAAPRGRQSVKTNAITARIMDCILPLLTLLNGSVSVGRTDLRRIQRATVMKLMAYTLMNLRESWVASSRHQCNYSIIQR